MLDPNVINNQPSSNLTTIENLHHYDFLVKRVLTFTIVLLSQAIGSISSNNVSFGLFWQAFLFDSW